MFILTRPVFVITDVELIMQVANMHINNFSNNSAIDDEKER